ncbi:hypothetical protein HYX12_01015 [Candidatus Woesearchaeota archaeon]|nr:hypothetical protein [Candidatus Woesearchaeota archaeon]
MVSKQENIARIKEHYRFNRDEILALLTAAILTGFIFSFRDWGDQFNLAVGLTNVVLGTLSASLLFFIRYTSQKWYGLFEGYNVTFKPWWTGMGIALILAFLTRGYLPLILIGGVSVAVMTRQRMGEYRYGFSYWNNGIIALWGIYSVLIAGILFGLGLYFWPGNYFFNKGLWMSLIFGFCTLIPIPQTDAFSIYYAKPWLYTVAILLMVVASMLLLSKTLIGLVICIIGGLMVAAVYMAIGSDK